MEDFIIGTLLLLLPPPIIIAAIALPLVTLYCLVEVLK